PLHAVSFPILRSAQPFCGEKTRLSHGLSVAQENPFADVSEYAFDDPARHGNTPIILYTVPESPAHRAGLRGGDEILSVNGVRTKRKGSKVLFRAMREDGDAPLWLLVRRGSKKRMAKVVPVAICDTPVVLASTQEVVSWSTRTKIKVGEGMVRFVRTDTELAVVVAHELSHILLLHTGEVFGRGSARYENDADYLGLYLVANAGFDPDQALGLFPRMAAAFPGMDGMQAYPTIARRWLKPSRKSRTNEPPDSIWCQMRKFGASVPGYERAP
ncbi:MAG: PDZ domain-containing protein, partial [Proteobacteria bacterium]|nr:PDZ domain-containing protein [Pseudomonadota bacterium]